MTDSHFLNDLNDLDLNDRFFRVLLAFHHSF